MSDIKRYDLVGEYDLSMEEMTEGDYVLYSDHEQQLKERDALLDECEPYVADIANWRHVTTARANSSELLTKIKNRNKP